VNFISAGRSLYLTNDLAGPHLWFVLTDPDPKTAHIVIVRVVTTRSHTDKTVVLATGCHPFIKRESNVEYGAARIDPVHTLEGAIHAGHCKLDQDMSKSLLAIVRNGLLASPRTIHYVADYCRARFP